MLSIANIKWIKSLGQKKFRKQEGLFVVEGGKMVSELLQSNLETIGIYATDSWLNNSNVAQDIECNSISQKQLERISSLTAPNQALALVKIPTYNSSQIIVKGNITLALDNIQDPGNLGTIIRTADWFGVKNIVCTEDTADVYSPKVIQATMGSIYRVKVHYCALETFLPTLPDGFPIMGGMLDGQNIFQTNLPQELVLVIGNESRGISTEIARFITQKVVIPRGNPNDTLPESLNAAVAAAIILSQIRK